MTETKLFDIKKTSKQQKKYGTGDMMFDMIKGFLLPKKLKDIKSQTLFAVSGILFFICIFSLGIAKLVDSAELLFLFVPSVLIIVVAKLLVKFKKIK